MKATIKGIAVELTPEEFMRIKELEEQPTKTTKEPKRDKSRLSWTEAEDKILRGLYGKKNYSEKAHKKLPHRSIKTIYQRASNLGLTKKRHKQQ